MSFGQSFNPRQLPGQANTLQVVVLLRKGPGVGAQPLALLRLVQQITHFLGQSGMVKEVHQLAGLPVLDRLVQGLGVAGHDGATCAHGFEQAPTENKGVGQVHMHRAQLQKWDEVLVSHITQKVHPAPVLVADLWAHLCGKDVLPLLAMLRAGAVAHIVSAHDQHPGIRSAPEDLRQRAHEDVVAPVGFEVAVDEGDDLVMFGERQLAVLAIEVEAHLGVGRHRLGVNAVMHHRDPGAKRLRERAGLPVRRRQPGIGHLKVQQVVEVLQAQAASVTRVLGRELRIKPHIGPRRVVEELAVNGQPGLGPHFLEKQALPPAVVGDDHIGAKALLLHLQGSLEASLPPDRLGLEVRHPGVDVGGGAPAGAVGHQLDALPVLGIGLLHGHGHHVVALPDQRRGQELELAGEVLVDEQDVHAHTLSTPSFKSQARARNTKG